MSGNGSRALQVGVNDQDLTAADTSFKNINRK
jgi:hypothetical protein